MVEDGVEIQDDRRKWDATMGAMRDLAGYRITVGVHGGGKPRPDMLGLTTAQLAAVHEFGATVNHPGGTPYKLVDGKAVFLSKMGPHTAGTKFTKPHTIKIPPRSFLRGAVDENIDAIWAQVDAAIAGIVDGKWNAQVAAERVALFVHGRVVKRMSDGLSPPLKASTIRRKTVGGKTGEKPLIDTGGLKASITWVLRIGVGGELASGGGS
jgi:hypothetical protein